jgi:hypothetical protein
LTDDQVRIAGNLPTLPIFLKEDVAKIGEVEKVAEELTCSISRMMATCERKKFALKNDTDLKFSAQKQQI